MVIKQFIDVLKFHDDVKLDDLDINNSFMNQSALYAHYAFMHLEAMRQEGNAEIVKKATHAKVDSELREKLDADNAAALAADPKAKIDKLTEVAIAARIALDPRAQQATKDHNDAEAILKFLGNVLTAFEQRKDMLISLGANQRQDKQGELRMMQARQVEQIQNRLSA